MAIIKPFRAIRPAPMYASQVAALPYDVYNRKEAKEAVQGNPLSFLNIDRPETQFEDDVDMYDPKVYEQAKILFQQQIQKQIYQKDPKAGYYIYELTMDGRIQTGIVACSSIDDYLNQVIRRHENTREEKEIDRIHHVDILNTQTGPIFLAYRSNETISSIIEKVKAYPPLYDFTSSDKISHRVWRIAKPELIEALYCTFSEIPNTYIADGHHRAASAVKVGLKRRKEHPDYSGEEEFNYFLSVLFPDDQLKILPGFNWSICRRFFIKSRTGIYSSPFFRSGSTGKKGSVRTLLQSYMVSHGYQRRISDYRSRRWIGCFTSSKPSSQSYTGYRRSPHR